MDIFMENQGKRLHDPLFLENSYEKANNNNNNNNKRLVYVSGPVIVGAGPSGLAVAACLRDKGVSSVVLERSNCIASLWQLKTYDRLRLHLPKQFCELPLMSFPNSFPTYPSKQQFISYLESYAKKFDIRPIFRANVEKARFDSELGLWRISCEVGFEKVYQSHQHQCIGSNQNSVVTENVEYVSRWLIVATGENAEAVVPDIEGVEEFKGGGGRILHTSLYKSGESYGGENVLVVGCGNSGMEVCLDLCNFNARPSLVVRDRVHVLPREMLGKSTFGLSMWLLKWLPITIVDRFLLMTSWLLLGDTARLGLDRPKLGPLQLKNLAGKTPVLDVGTLAKIRSGHIKVCPGIRRLRHRGVEFVDGTIGAFDSIILATGYKSNVPSWLKEDHMFSDIDGLPRRPYPNGWRGENGLYAVGFTKRGLLGTSMDAKSISQDIERYWKNPSKYIERPPFIIKHDF